MNILVIGNGFDLAHGLLTKYKDFLDFVQEYEECYKTAIKDSKEIVVDSNLKKMISDFLKLRYNSGDSFEDIKNEGRRDRIKKLIEETHNLIQDNIWIEYFLQCDMYNKENWIDFESEISEVIQSIDHDMGQGNFNSNIILLSNKFFNNQYTNNVVEYSQATAEEQEKIRKPETTYQKLKDILLGDLDKLIRALEIYLTDFVEKMEISKISKDIKELDIDHVLSFNYTDTFEKLYGENNNIEYDYIHGKADNNNTIVTNNMVLGIDEYLSKKRRNKDIEFIAFKKYYQRIHKQTGCKYREWADKIGKEYKGYKKSRNKIGIEILESINDKSFDLDPFLPRKYGEKLQEKCPQHNLYIFGHSLDVTDKDILRDLILHDNVHTTIYYLNKDVMGQQIANLVKVIGQDELIKRTGGSTKTIVFKLQQDMVEI